MFKLLNSIFLSCHVRFSEWTTLYSCLNVKKLLVQSRREISSLRDCTWTRTQNHLVNKHPTIWSNLSSVRLRTKWFWARVQLQSFKLLVILFTITLHARKDVFNQFVHITDTNILKSLFNIWLWKSRIIIRAVLFKKQISFVKKKFSHP